MNNDDKINCIERKTKTAGTITAGLIVVKNPFWEAKLIETKGFGMSVSSSRFDDLDQMALAMSDRHPTFKILDLCCGQGALAQEFADRGRDATAFDIFRPDEPLRNVVFFQGDLWSNEWPVSGPFDIVVWQRALHYFPSFKLPHLLEKIRSIMSPGGSIFLSASGLTSELAIGYDVKDAPVKKRFGSLSKNMAEKHGIFSPVCLYRMEELLPFLMTAGFCVQKAFLSEFGNIKVHAIVE